MSSASQVTEVINLELLQRFDQPVPRYTSYPTAPDWEELTSEVYGERLLELNTEPRDLSLYLHIPFCKTMCLFCGCSVILNRKPENESRYVEYLLKEIDLVAERLQPSHRVSQLHLGGGTPTKLSVELIERVYDGLDKRFNFAPQAEIAIEIDPRTVVEDHGEKLRLLRRLGFNRVSFGVQDTDPQVQEAIRRRQSYAMTLQTYELARQLDFDGINIDLIYGLPLQSVQTFSDTMQKILEMRPDRIALFSYAKVPWLKEHQKAIPDATLPTTDEKFRIYLYARQALIEAGYVAIGMDHFALAADPMAAAYHSGELHRNFQGYTVNRAEDMLGFGSTAIGHCRDTYIQNLKSLDAYYAALDDARLPVHRGKVLSETDRLRRWVIKKLMCQFELDKALFEQMYGVCFNRYFAAERPLIEEAISQGLCTEDNHILRATDIGKLFIRHVASLFDWYLQGKGGTGHYSKGV